jgi:hypothetical protein
MEEGIPFTDPSFYASKTRCPDSLITYIFRAATECKESIPLLQERIAILRENGSILCKVISRTYCIKAYLTHETDSILEGLSKIFMRPFSVDTVVLGRHSS